MDAAVAKDKRFAQIAKDPRFHRMKRKDRKVTIDKRFHGMFDDKRFKLKYTVDKRGRPVRTSTNDHLQQYYDLSDEENEEGSAESDEDENVKGKKDKKRSKKKEDESDESESDVEGDDAISESKTISAVEKGKVKQKTKGNEESSEEDSENGESSDDAEEETDLARGVGNEETSSDESEEDDDDDDGKDLARGEGNVETSSDESDDEESEEEEAFDHKWGELHYTAPPAEEITSRMAVCNMDWDRMKANDIFVLLNSFKPTGGIIKSVAIYPSEFGKERMAEEDVKGPKELVERGPQDDEVEEGSDLQREKMRQYQLNRLRYYYAVVECDGPETANAIYEECDGIEYESTATRMDLRFIPNEMTFDDTPKTLATCMPDSSTYKPSQFITTALQQSKVDLTWDETDRDRTAVTMRKFTKEDLEDLDMKDYLASSESEGEDPYADFLEQPDFGQPEKDESDEVVLSQYKDILKTTKDKGKKEKKSDIGLEISWDPNLMEEAEKKVLKKSSGNETPWEQYLVKKKEKKKKEKKKKKSDKDNDKTEETQESGKTNKKKSKKLKETTETVEENKSHQEEEEEGDAFSDDDLPSDVDMEDDFFKDEINQQQPAGPSDKKRKKKKGKPKDDEDKKKKMAELALLMEDNEEDRNHFNLKDIIEKEGSSLSKTKRKKLKKLKKKQEEQGVKVAEDTFKVDVSDPRFEDIFKNPHYNIDPSASEFKATKATDALIQEKLRRRQQESKLGAVKAKKRQSEGAAEGISATKQSRKDSNEEGDSHSANTKDHSLATLVKSVKAKTQTLKQKKRR